MNTPSDPVPMLLFCPRCGIQHIDTPDPEKHWTNPPHKSHQCQNARCGWVWRPADVATIGVSTIATAGFKDLDPAPRPSPTAILNEKAAQTAFSLFNDTVNHLERSGWVHGGGLTSDEHPWYFWRHPKVGGTCTIGAALRYQHLWDERDGKTWVLRGDPA